MICTPRTARRKPSEWPNEPRNPCSLLRSVESAFAATKKQKTARTVAKAIGLEKEEMNRWGRGNISAGLIQKKNIYF